MRAPGTRRVGLLVGRENTFPQRFLEEVWDRGREYGVTAEMALLGGTAELEEPAYAVIVDRISHEVPYCRALQVRAEIGHLVGDAVHDDGVCRLLELRGAAQEGQLGGHAVLPAPIA